MAALEPCCMFFGAKLAISSKMIALKIVKWIIAGKKKRFCWPLLVMDAKSLAGFSPSRQCRFERNDVKNTPWLPRQFQNGGLRSHFFHDEFVLDNGHFRGWKVGEWKSWESFLLWAKPKNVSFLEWPSPLSIIKDQLRALVAYGVVRNKLNDSSSKRLKNVRSLT